MGRRSRRLAPFAVLLVGLLLVTIANVGLARVARDADRERFLSLVEDMQGRVVRQIDRQLTLLNGVAALFHAHQGALDYDSFRLYVAGLDLNKRVDGILRLGYAARVDPEEVPAAEMLFREVYGLPVAIRPPLGKDEGYPVLYLRPDDEANVDNLGLDLFSNPLLRQAMERARDRGEPAASEPYPLDVEPGGRPSAAFLIFLPHYRNRAAATDEGSRRATIQGFVYATFRASDFFSAALFPSARTAVRLVAYDEASGSGLALFNSHDQTPPDTALQERRLMSVAGRHWVLQFSATQDFRSSLPTVVLAAFVILGVLLAGAASAVVHFQVRAVDHAEREADAARRNQAEKELLLQEMKHRIKNSLSRVAAISRQTARSAASIEEFVAAFDARIRAMSASQDLLTRSRERTSIRDLLRAEIVPVLGEDESRYQISGPNVLLEAREALALGLTFHELATNALKYGGLAEDGAWLEVGWGVEEVGVGSRVRIIWREHCTPAVAAPGQAGFGSRLIDLSIKQELGGDIERRFGPSGFSAVISIPLKRDTLATEIYADHTTPNR